jgi:hypothetical protein
MNRKRIRIWADIDSTGLFDDLGRYFTLDETTISKDTWEELQKWVEDYDFITPLPIEMRRRRLREIEELDRRGLVLKSKVQTEWTQDMSTGEPLDFVYFSEGLLKELDAQY